MTGDFDFTFPPLVSFSSVSCLITFDRGALRRALGLVNVLNRSWSDAPEALEEALAIGSASRARAPACLSRTGQRLGLRGGHRKRASWAKGLRRMLSTNECELSQARLDVCHRAGISAPWSFRIFAGTSGSRWSPF